MQLTVPCSSSGAWAEIMDFLAGKCHLGTIPQLLQAATAWGDHPLKRGTPWTNTGCAERIEHAKINPFHVLWEPPQETKAHNNCKVPNAGTTYLCLGTSTDTTLEGSEIPVQSHEVTVTVSRGFISPYNNAVVQHGSGAFLSLLTKPQVSNRCIFITFLWRLPSHLFTWALPASLQSFVWETPAQTQMDTTAAVANKRPPVPQSQLVPEKWGGKRQRQRQPPAELGGPGPVPAPALEPLLRLLRSGAALTSPAGFNVTATLHSTLHPIPFEADKDCFCFISIGLLMAYSLLSRCIFIR